uniref:DUF4810 domain-containing protein n=1 Tax=Ningiella ruwaisensis TaxID=2364274 RepID=UPI0010A07A90|nr:DUF4810 domain-containing protein [Ningiella ruwaisensis]
MKQYQFTTTFWLITIFFILTGCKTTEPLYYYGSYQQAVYSYFKTDNLTRAEQIQQLELTIQEAGDRPVPPGLHAHLGMLYIEAGDADLGLSHLQTEKELFPESAAYIDFLLRQREGV